MTLAKYAIQYSKWSTGRHQGVCGAAWARAHGQASQADHGKRRRLWIHRLHAKDKAATIRFLDFPPEIRNVVYGFLLAPQLHPEPDVYYLSPKCHPNILSSYKQVNAEAADVIAVQYELSLFMYNDGVGGEGYHFNVHLNNTSLAQESEGGRDVKLLGPQSLAKLRCIELDITLYDHRRLSTSQLHDLERHEETGGLVHTNHVLYDLYRFLEKKNSLEQLDVNISAANRWTKDTLERVLSPIAVLLGMVEKATLTTSTYALLGTYSSMIQRTADLFRKVRHLEQDAITHGETQDRPIPNLLQTAGSHPLEPSTRSNILASCQLATSVRHSGSMYAFASHGELSEAIASIQRRLFDMKAQVFKDKVKEAKEKLMKLKEQLTRGKTETGVNMSE